MLTMLPPPPASIAGRNALMVWCMDLTLRSNEKSQSCSEQSRMVPWCTKPAALSRMSIFPMRLAKASTSAVLRTSSRAVSAMPSLPRVAMPLSLMSVAITVAPSRANAIAHARPMPAAAAVTTARFPFSRSDIFFFSLFPLVIARGEASILAKRRGGLFRCARNDGNQLVIIPRHADRACNILIARGELHAGAGGLLADGRAIDLLPRRLVGRVGEAALGLQLGAPLVQLVARDQDIGVALVEVDTDLVAGPQDREPAVGGGLRRGVEDRGRTRGAGLPSVADAGQREDTAFDQRRRRLHVHHLGAAGIADRPGAADEQHAVLVDVERGIVDPVVIILW